jgi:hypothetical protein
VRPRRLPQIAEPGSPRAFRVRRIPPYIGRPFWKWECTLCHPPATGGRYGWDAQARIIAVSMKHHFRVREYHHKYVLETRGKTI